ncbi:MAG: uroporphyrinogen decarboxylase family protein, partial [Candidatus Bathyarchaeia archaeon]
RWMYYEPRVIDKAMERLTDFNVKVIDLLTDFGAELIISTGDYCEKKGTMVPIKFFEEKIFPNLKKQVEAAHRKGVKFIKHTDGNINPILDKLANIVDGLHSLDPTAGVDIGLVKENYGDKLVLMGNVAVDTLSRKDKEEVIKETKECIKNASPGGGHFLSSSNSWYTDAKLENCLAMVKAGRKYGRYPIKIMD